MIHFLLPSLIPVTFRLTTINYKEKQNYHYTVADKNQALILN